jgi:glutamyl-Q tRNA(Asp) synthetase
VAQPLVTRFAPSPTGYLHRGHAYSALTAFSAAQAASGRFLLRIEDIDATRCRPEYETALLEDLAWLGLTWEIPVRRQSDHLPDYDAALQRLRDAHLAYRCFKTRREIAEAAQSAPHGLPLPYTGAPLSPDEEAQRLAAGQPFAWRLSLAAARAHLDGFDLTFTEAGETRPADPTAAGDIVLARKDVGVAYHLAVVVDDALQGVTQVIRGQDLYDATPVQRLLQTLLDLPAPTYRHHPLLVGPDGRRYAKRDQAQTLREIRQSGVTADQLRRELGFS